VKIAGLQKTTLLDFPGCLACVVFSPGCNFRCPYCHNPSLVVPPGPEVSEERGGDLPDLEAFIDSRAGWLEGVVFSGGEPTLQEGLEEALVAVRRRGISTKLDTNGSRPDVLAHLLSRGLLDYVALDVKAPGERYHAVTGVPASPAVGASLALLRSWSGVWEARTTVIPGLVSPEDVELIAREITPVPRYVLQPFRPQTTWDPTLGATPPPAEEDLERAATWASALLPQVFLRSNSGEVRPFKAP